MLQRAVSARSVGTKKKKPTIPIIIFAMVSVQRNSLWSSSYGMNFSSESSNTNRSVSPIGPVPSSSVRLWLPNAATTVKPESSSVGTYSLFSAPKSPYQAPVPPVGSRGVYSRSPPLPVPSDPLDSVLGTFPCARLRGLPMDTCVEDVLVFFHGFVVLDIVIVPHAYNGPAEAFVLFSNLADFQVALQRDRQRLADHVIEVYQGKRSDYYAAIAWQHASMQKIAMSGGDGEERHAQDPPISDISWSDNVGFVPSQSLRSSSLQAASNALNPLYGGHGSNHMSVLAPGGQVPRSSRGSSVGEGVRIARSSVAGRGNGRGGGIQVGEHTGYLRMRGLPFTSSKSDIAEFFKEYDPIPESISLTYRSDGRATGEGYIAFMTPENAKDAMNLHRNSMGSRYIELFISNKDEHSRAVARESSLR